MLTQRDRDLLRELARMSKAVGERVDYTQGGGGNTSVKLDNGLMAVKASGYRLTQLTENEGFAIVETATLADLTERAGFAPRRPSVEASFHALLGRYVMHTHPVYANLALCAQGGEAMLTREIVGYPYIFLPYINPGAELAAAMKEKLEPDTRVIFMQNHGLVVTADTAEECVAIHADVNARIGGLFGVTQADFNALAASYAKILYPDQQVYLTLTAAQSEIVTAVAFIQFTLLKNGVAVQSMDESAQDFIANWESEQYRKSILQ